MRSNLIVPAYIKRALHAWNVWRVRQRLYRACPALRDVDASERAALRAHRPVRPIRAERRYLMHALLAREVECR